MKAAVEKESKRPWAIEDLPDPKPMENQVLIKIKASGLCYTDVHQTEGDLPGNFPRILGHEPVGEIVAVGPGVRSRKIGDRVGVPWVQIGCGRCEFCLRGKSNFCAQQLGTSMQMNGGHAEFMVAYADATMLIPDNVSFAQAAPIFCAGYTVWSGLRWAEPQPGEKVAVVGVGGLGHLAVQYAAATGFDVLAVSRSPDKDEMIKKLGAGKIVRDGAELGAAGGADVILCTGNSAASMVDSIKGARPDARLVVMGFDPEPLQISTGDFIMKRLKVIGSQQNRPEFLLEALNLVASGKVKVHTEVYGFSEINKAYERVEQGKVRFRAVVEFN
jgi:alcohol dehydrogenase